MKKITLLAVALFLGVFLITSCQKDCKNCKAVTKDSSGNIVDPGTDSEYCDVSLTAKENAEPVTVGSNTTTWVCQ
jgi:hypothetical protein